jgi:beta-lactamase class A
VELPDLSRLVPAARWGVCLQDADTGDVLAELDADALLPTASVAKLYALVDLAARSASGELAPELLLDRRVAAPVHDSGVWQHLLVDRLPMADVAVLVAAVSDNLATNVLLEVLGLDRVQQRAADLAPGGSMLHDAVRDERGPDDAPMLSSGCARDWARFFAALHRDELVSAEVSAQVRGWTAASTDLSMVASALALDPLAHREEDLGVRIWNKTGTDAGVRADVGLVRSHGRAVSYAVICAWEEAGGHAARQSVLDGMRAVGHEVLAFLHP